MSEDVREPEAPVLRVVRGKPDEAEIAALTTALLGAAAANAAPEPTSRPLSMWADRGASLPRPASGGTPRPGRHAWRASALPR